MHVRPIPKVSIFMAVTNKKVTEKAQKWAKMARFWSKTRYNGRVMAREIFFYQCLWVTNFCAKFGRSRIPRTASAHKSFIVLRCMWKEPAPFKNRPTAVSFKLFKGPARQGDESELFFWNTSQTNFSTKASGQTIAKISKWPSKGFCVINVCFISFLIVWFIVVPVIDGSNYFQL